MSRPKKKKVPHHLWNQATPPPLPEKCPNSSKKVPQKFWNKVTPPLSEKFPKTRRKVPQKVWNQATPPPFLKKCPNMNRTKKFLEKFGFRHDPPPPLAKF